MGKRLRPFSYDRPRRLLDGCPRRKQAHSRHFGFPLGEMVGVGPVSVIYSVTKSWELHCGTLDGRNPAPLKKPCNDDPPVDTNKRCLPMVSEWCER